MEARSCTPGRKVCLCSHTNFTQLSYELREARSCTPQVAKSVVVSTFCVVIACSNSNKLTNLCVVIS
jgi:hypothetical protein